MGVSNSPLSRMPQTDHSTRLKGNHLSQTSGIANEQKNAKVILSAASKNAEFSAAEPFLAYFIVKLGARQRSRTASDHNHFLGGRTKYKRFACGVAPAPKGKPELPIGL